MHRDTTPISQDMVFVGGGHSHAIALRHLAMQSLPGVRMTLISSDTNAAYSGMLPGYIAGHYSYDDIHIDLRSLCRFANARFYQDEVIGIDLANQSILCRHRPAVAYDVVSLNIGTTPDVSILGDSARYITAVKPVNRFIAHWEALVQRVATCHNNRLLSVAVVGAGAGGIELVLAMQHRLQVQQTKKQRCVDRLRFHLFARGHQCLPTHAPRIRRLFRSLLTARGIHLHFDAPVTAVEANAVITADGQRHTMDEVLWATSASAQPWLRESGMAVDERGFVAVDAALESLSHPRLFACGDCAAIRGKQREKAGVFAVRHGKPLAYNLRRVLANKKPRSFVLQHHFLNLISTGDRCAAATRGLAWSLAPAAWIWIWKDWVDRRFMAQFDFNQTSKEPALVSALTSTSVRALASAKAAAGEQRVPYDAMRCGGCGAKVGANVLRRVLHELGKRFANQEVININHFDDDAAVSRFVPQQLSVHSVDGFRSMIDDPYLFGRIVANHALNDMYAMGATPITVLALVTLPYAPESKTEDTLRQLMSGVLEVLSEAHTALIGGHTGEGVELNLGLAVNGSVSTEQLLRKSGVRSGDRLILTKPIGSGTLFAADMRYRAKGRWIAAALRTLQQSNRVAAQCFQRYGASAATDITGFGLLGHLLEMLSLPANGEPTALKVTLNLNAIPLMEGALETISAGIASTLQEQNMQAALLLTAPKEVSLPHYAARYALLFDPQTAGGLLASVAPDRVTDCINELHARGYSQAAVIGEASPRGNGDRAVLLKCDT